MTMVRDSDDDAIDEARSAASMLQSKQLISTNVVTKRKEQLSRWEKSEMNMEPPVRRRRPNVQFMDDDIFLSACMFGDEDEVDELLLKGADINTGTVDGLTALHQSVIDSKPEMVRFLCQKGANVNSQDNEGWTPLHAAACCGNVSIVQLLVEAGADLSAINCDKELAVDLAENDECRDYLEGEYAAKGIDLEDAREAELSIMMRDAKEWIRNGVVNEKPHPKTGATALHVAAAKGYTQIVDLLITAGADVNALDYDGWTPLHAAAHWGEKNCKEVCGTLLKEGASIDANTLAGQSVIGVTTDRDVLEYLEVEKVKRDAAKEKERAKKETSVLSEKNGRIGSGSSLASAAAVVQPVTPSASTTSITTTTREERPAHSHMSTEQKHALTVADERSENETLHPVKVPRLGPLGASSSNTEERPPLPSRTPPAAASEEESGNKMNTSVTRSLGRSSSDRESSASSSITPSERSSSSSSARMDVTSAPAAVEPPATAAPVAAPPPAATAAPAAPTSAPPAPAAATPTTVQFTVPLRSWNRPAPLSSSARSSSTSTSSAALAPSSTSASIASPTIASSPLTVKPPPWQSATVASQESESERRQTARMQRAHRRSTQGVTKEQLEEASRLAAEESAKRRTSQASVRASSGSSIPSGPCRLASEEKDSSAERSLIGTTPLAAPRISAEVRLAERRESSDRYSDSSRTSPASSIAPSSREGSAAPSGSLTNTGTLSLATGPAPSSTPSAANVRRKSSQILSGMAVRSARRGTGPVSAEDIAAAAAAEREERSAARATAATAAGVATSSVYQSSARRLIGNETSTTTTTATVTPFQSSTGTTPVGIGRSPSVGGGTVTGRDGLSTSVSRVAPRVASSALSGGTSERSTGQFAAPTISSTAAANVNYRLMYEKERTENEKLRRELERSGAPPPEMNGSSASSGLSSARRVPSRLTTSQSLVGGLSKSPSGGSMEDAERRTLERRITELELELKTLGQLRLENQRLKEENGALVRVISKMTI